MVKNQDCDVSQTTHRCGRTSLFCCTCVVYVLACRWTTTLPTHTHPPTRFQLYSVHSQKRGFITAAWPQHLTYQPLDFQSQCGLFCVCCHWVLFICEKREMVWEACCRLAFVCVRIWVCSCESCPPNCVCICMYVHCLAGGICVVLFVLKVFPHSDPRGGSRTERQRERERGRESAFAVPSRPHTNHFIVISGN